ncbi:MAG: hypothetical protein PVH84_02210 [Candidatus Aminicenantes bacterium]|jgi:hypothetical protein
MLKKIFVIVSIILLSGVFCGKKGPIYPPLVKIPQKIEDLDVFQRGDTIVLQWSNPTSYVDGGPIDGNITIELWLLKVEKALARQQRSLTEETFAGMAQLHEAIEQEDFVKFHASGEGDSKDLIYIYEIPSEEFSKMVFVFGLKVKDRKNKTSEFSPLFPVIPRSIPRPPQEVKVNMRENSVAIEWKTPEENIDSSTPPNVVGYNVYREAENEKFHRINSALIEGTSFEDNDYANNVTYRYYVRASATRSSPFTESGNSKAAEILTVDTLIPVPPAGLVAIAGNDFVSLTWNANKETDLAGYRVWRKRQSEKKFVAVTELIAENVYYDSEVEKGQRYYYAITALDVNGNESQRSEAVSIVLGREEL